MTKHPLVQATIQEATRLYYQTIEKFLSELDDDLKSMTKVFIDRVCDEPDIVIHRDICVLDKAVGNIPIATIIVRAAYLKLSMELIDRRYRCPICCDMGFTTNISIGRDGVYTPEHWACHCQLKEEPGDDGE